MTLTAMRPRLVTLSAGGLMTEERERIERLPSARLAGLVHLLWSGGRLYRRTLAFRRSRGRPATLGFSRDRGNFPDLWVGGPPGQALRRLPPARRVSRAA